MCDCIRANDALHDLLKRPDILEAYAMVPPTDAWYDTITTVHNSLAEIQKLPHDHLEITSYDGLKLKALYYPGKSNVTVICALGYTSHAEREWAYPGLFYHSLGYNVLIPYQRAHGPSEGKYISFGALENRDMMGWIDRINDMIPEGRIILHGLSMGGEIVLYLADKEMENVKCLIADAPNVSIDGLFREVANEKNGDKNLIYQNMRKDFNEFFSVDLSDFEVINFVKHSRYPILLAAGSMEKLEDTFRDLAAANPQETDIIILPGCNHGNGMYKQTEMFQTAIRNFIARYIGR